MDTFLFGEKLGEQVTYQNRGAPSGVEYYHPMGDIFKSTLKKKILSIFTGVEKNGPTVLHNIFYSKNAVLEIKTVPADVANGCHWPILPTGERPEAPSK